MKGMGFIPERLLMMMMNSNNKKPLTPKSERFCVLRFPYPPAGYSSLEIASLQGAFFAAPVGGMLFGVSGLLLSRYRCYN